MLLKMIKFSEHMDDCYHAGLVHSGQVPPEKKAEFLKKFQTYVAVLGTA